MKILLHKLCTINVHHEFYEGLCPDVELVPTESTKATLRGHRILWKRLAAGSMALLADRSHALNSLPSETLRLAVIATNPALGNYTAPDDLPTESGVPVYGKSTAPTALAPAYRTQIVGPIFQHDLARREDVTLQAAHDRSEYISSQVVDGAANPSVQYDLRPHGPGVYTMVETYTTPPSATTKYSILPEFQGRMVAGFVDFTISSRNLDSPTILKLQLTSNLQYRRYYIISDRLTSAEIQQLRIVDQGASIDGRAQVIFDAVSPTDFTQAETYGLALTASPHQLIMFRSTAKLPRMLRPRRRLALLLNNELQLQNLPNPGPQSPHQDIVVRT